ncbi:Tyrosine-protein phosphatase non-receptor type 14 [Daphnia magna]|uniref:Tyrosine-protein phosphatase non-receptor type 14 n=1 Tax=Daphnia magna TaxID=35525 RepID=A0A164GV95_9CRUS|nr:Tyrosine-protein phosphatase non-receptor type 14 [Daphnia magna]
MFGIECQRSEKNVNFYFDDPEAARYVWKLAVLQIFEILAVLMRSATLIVP